MRHRTGFTTGGGWCPRERRAPCHRIGSTRRGTFRLDGARNGGREPGSALWQCNRYLECSRRRMRSADGEPLDRSWLAGPLGAGAWCAVRRLFRRQKQLHRRFHCAAVGWGGSAEANASSAPAVAQGFLLLQGSLQAPNTLRGAQRQCQRAWTPAIASPLAATHGLHRNDDFDIDRNAGSGSARGCDADRWARF